MHQLMWFRTDLRVHDNPALRAAMEAGPTIALFLLTPQQWRAHGEAPAKVDFWLRNLQALATELDALNVPLQIRTASYWRSIPRTLSQLCNELQIDAVHANEEYGVNESARDHSVKQRLEEQDRAWHSYLDQVFLPPGSVTTHAGGYFKVFSQFAKVCRERLQTTMPDPQAKPRAQDRLKLKSDEVPDRVTGFAPPDVAIRDFWPAGEKAAHQRLDHFTAGAISEYATDRDVPAEDGTSRISAYLNAGVVSPQQCLAAARAANHGHLSGGQRGAATWIGELIWREFYRHILVGFPQVSRHRAFHDYTEALPWRDAPADLQAWKDGQTGIPIVDAAMRQLMGKGWMHNRLRMITAMFLSKNLLIDWREGERWFMAHLVDGDLANNNGGWQWSASTGTDSVPYFRLFNPITQSQRFDPTGEFIREWVPELKELDNKSIHQPNADQRKACGYPAPLVDLRQSRQRALEAYKGLKRS